MKLQTTTTLFTNFTGAACTGTLETAPAAPGAIYTDTVVAIYDGAQVNQHFYYVRMTPNVADPASTPSYELLAVGVVKGGDCLGALVKTGVSAAEQKSVLKALDATIGKAQAKRPASWFTSQLNPPPFAAPLTNNPGNQSNAIGGVLPDPFVAGAGSFNASSYQQFEQRNVNQRLMNNFQVQVVKR